MLDFAPYFSSRCCLTCLKCITLSCDCQVVIFLTLRGRFVLRYFFQLVYILSHVYVIVNDFFEKLLKVIFMYYYVLLTLSILSHENVIVNSFFKNTIKFFQNVCSIKIDPVNYSICSISTITTEKCRNTVTLWCGGLQKLKRQHGNAAEPIADSSTDFLQDFTLSTSSKFSTKSSKIQKSSSSNHLSYHISLKPTKIKHFIHFTTKKSNSHFTKNSSIISKLSLFISTFTDNHFPSKKL